MPKKFIGEPFTLSLASGTKIIYASEGYVTIIRRKFLSHSTETIPRGTLLCSVSENFWWRKSLWIRSVEGDYLNIPSKKFCLTVPKQFRRGTLLCCVSGNIWWRKSLWKRRGRGVSKLSVEKFLSYISEKIRRGTLLSFINFGYRIYLCFRG